MSFETIAIVDKSFNRYPYIEGHTLVSVKDYSEHEKVCVYIPAKVFQKQITEQEGQINMSTEFGKLLFFLMSSENGPKLWLEVGAWNGKGTTTCILEGLLKRDNREGVQFLSYEASPLFYEIAKENLQKYESLHDYFTLVHAKLPSSLPFPQAEFIPDKEEHFKKYYEEEKYLYENISAYHPTFSPEVVVLDGGEYIGYQDWEAIPKDNLKHILLDDCSIYKNKCVFEVLKHLSDWECVIHKPNDRNGWAYWKKRTPSA